MRTGSPPFPRAIRARPREPAAPDSEHTNIACQTSRGPPSQTDYALFSGVRRSSSWTVLTQGAQYTASELAPRFPGGVQETGTLKIAVSTWCLRSRRHR